MNEQLLLRTPHGSRLYGLAHADSDHDTYEIYAGKEKSAQRMNGKDDSFTTSLSEFLKMCDAGTPQALEAMFSSQKETAPEYDAFFAGYRAGSAAMLDKYTRTALNFSKGERGQDYSHSRSFKQRRHALRLCLNLADGLAFGRFNPTLTEAEAQELTRLAEQEESAYLETFNAFLESAKLGYRPL